MMKRDTAYELHRWKKLEHYDNLFEFAHVLHFFCLTRHQEVPY